MNLSPPITYCLIINNSSPKIIKIGKLGKIYFPKGKYFYIGSAKKNIEARIKRHLSLNKKLFWHIDYFLKEEGVKIERVKFFRNRECWMAKRFLKRYDFIKNFGSSDCPCLSHLFYKS